MPHQELRRLERKEHWTNETLPEKEITEMVWPHVKEGRKEGMKEGRKERTKE